MKRHAGITIALLLALLTGPFGLLGAEHGHLHHEEDGDSALHPECPVCFAARTAIVVATPPAPLPAPVPRTVLPTPRPETREAAALLRTFSPRGPPPS